MPSTIVVLGARNLGGAIIDHFRGLGWNTAAVARSDETLDRVRARGGLALAGDASDSGAFETGLSAARPEFASLEAVVTAVSAARPPLGEPFGGGELAQADLEAFRG